MYGGLFATIGKLTKDWRLSPETNAVIYEAYQVGLWLRENTPPQSRCATWDAGVIGYFAHRPVINLDGLVNTYDFLPLLKSKLLPTYLKEKNVRYLTTYHPGNRLQRLLALQGTPGRVGIPSTKAGLRKAILPQARRCIF
jgi:hypothetical protein